MKITKIKIIIQMIVVLIQVICQVKMMKKIKELDIMLMQEIMVIINIKIIMI